MKKSTLWSMVVLLSVALMGCGKCEHEYDSGVITREPTCISEGEKTYTCQLCNETQIESIPKNEHTYREEITKESTFDVEGEKEYTCKICGLYYTESIPRQDKQAFNQSVYEQMVEYYHNDDYINALVIGNNAIASPDEAKAKIDDLTKEIFSTQMEYVMEQLQNAFENKNYEIINALYMYQYHNPIRFNDEQREEYEALKEIQGIYNCYKSSDESAENIEINGYSLIIGTQEYLIDYELYQPNILLTPDIYAPRFKFQDGYLNQAIGMYGVGVRKGVVEITFENGKTGLYYNNEGKSLINEEEGMKQKEDEIAQREKAKEQEHLANVPKISMTADEVKETNWGEPNKINKTTYSWGVSEQWCYSKNRYVYLDDGIVTAIQE